MTNDEKRAAVGAMVTAFTLIAAHVASHAARDSLFLTAYDISSLPWMVICSALVSALSVVLTASALRRFGPLTVLRAGCLASGVLFILEALLLERLPRVLPVVAFLHITSLGSLLISAFWSVINERFDPRKGRRVVARAEAFAALGGVVGGVTSERLVAHTYPSALLVLAAGLCGLAFVASMLSPSGATRVEQGVDDSVSAKDVLRNQYARRLAAIVMLVALSSTLLDYTFKAEATRTVHSGASLARVFAIYHTVVGILTFLVQLLVGGWILRAVGPAGAAGSLPTVVGGVGVFTLFFPGFWSMSILRGLEAVMQNSFYRSGYELFFIPIDSALKRKAKAALDVGVDKFGDSVGAGITLALVSIWVEADQRLFVAVAMASSGAAAWFVYLVRKSYIAALGDHLRTSEDEHRRPIGSYSGFSRVDTVAEHPFVALGSPRENVPVSVLIAKVKSLAVRRKEREIRALEDSTFNAGLAATVVVLLEDDVARPAAERYLRTHVQRCTGMLTDALLEPSHSEKLRRRIPRILRTAADERAAAGLLAALDDEDFEVRFRAGLALSSLIRRHPSAKIPEEIVFKKAKEALEDHDRAWDQVIQMDEDEVNVSVLQASDHKHYNKGLQHVFEILGLCLERDVLRRALRALWSGNEEQRGTALEYLGEVLPEDLRAPLWPKLKFADQLAPVVERKPSGAAIDGVERNSMPDNPKGPVSSNSDAEPEFVAELAGGGTGGVPPREPGGV